MKLTIPSQVFKFKVINSQGFKSNIRVYKHFKQEDILCDCIQIVIISISKIKHSQILRIINNGEYYICKQEINLQISTLKLLLPALIQCIVGDVSTVYSTSLGIIELLDKSFKLGMDNNIKDFKKLINNFNKPKQ